MSFNVTLPIPKELVARVFEFLPLKDQGRAALVCKDFAYAAVPAMLRSLQEKDKILRERLKPLIDTLSEEGKRAASENLVIDRLLEYPLYTTQLGIIQDCHNTTLTAKIAAILKESLGLPSSDMDIVAVCVLRRRPEDVATNLFEQIYNRRKYPLWGDDCIYHRVECVRALHLIAHAIPDDKSSFSWNYISDQYFRLLDFPNALLTARKILDPERKFEILENIIRRYSASNNTQNALSVLGEALVVAKEMPDKDKKSRRYGIISLEYQRLGDLANAVVAAKEMSDKDKRSGRLVFLGDNYQMLGDLENALVVLKLAFESSMEIGDLSDKCTRLLTISERFQSLDDRHYALVALNEAFFSVRSITYSWGKYDSLVAVMRKYQALSDVQSTIDVLGELLVCIRDLKDTLPRNHRGVYDNQFVYFSKMYQGFGDLTQSLGVAREIEDLPRRNLRLEKISEEYQRISDLGNALVVAKEISIDAMKDKRFEAISLAYEALDDLANAVVAAKEISDKDKRSERLAPIGCKYQSLGDLKNALVVTMVIITPIIKSKRLEEIRSHMKLLMI